MNASEVVDTSEPYLLSESYQRACVTVAEGVDISKPYLLSESRQRACRKVAEGVMNCYNTYHK